jgi:hypothetical protein
MTLRDFAIGYEVDRRTVADLARQYGSTPATSHDCTTTSTVTGSTPNTSSTAAPCPDLAAEKGMTAPHISRWAQRHGIAHRPPGLASTAANLTGTGRRRTGPGTAAAGAAPDGRPVAPVSKRCCDIRPSPPQPPTWDLLSYVGVTTSI